MAIYTFGAGSLYAVGLKDATGTTIATPTPIKIMTMQHMSFDIKYDIKKLYGGGQFPEYVAGGKGDLKGKFSQARVNVKAMAALTGRAASLGTMSKIFNDVTGTAIPATPYQITPTAPSSGTLVDDLGVLTSAGVPMAKVTGTPTTGQYAFASGVYTFAAADTTDVVFINYRYTYTLANGGKIAMPNLPMGSLPSFKLFADVKSPNGFNCTVVLYSVTCPSLQPFNTKLDDFGMQDIDFEGFQDNAGNTVDWWIEE